MRSRKAQGRTMFFRMLARAAMLRKRSALAALLATVVAAAAATAMLNLFWDVQGKLQREFRNFGANIVVEAPEGTTLSDDAVRSIQAAVNGQGLAVPFAYAVARTGKDQAVVVAGTDLEAARKLNPWWAVSSWPQTSEEALLGVRAARLISPEQKPFSLHYQGRKIQLSPAGWVCDRRRDFAIMKALGASDRLIALFVAGEAAVLASAGAVLGFSGGIGIAAWIGRANFHAPVAPRFELFPAILAGCLVVTLSSTVLPLRLLRRIQPAMILRGE